MLQLCPFAPPCQFFLKVFVEFLQFFAALFMAIQFLSCICECLGELLILAFDGLEGCVMVFACIIDKHF